MTFRVISTIDVQDETEIPAGFTGRVRHTVAGKETAVAWYVGGVLDDPGRSHPAYRRYRADGQLKYEMHFVNGVLHDPSDREPAVRGYFANGQLHYAEHYRNGKRNDSPDGAPAVTKWRSDGTVRHQLHYCNGRRLSGHHL